MGVSSQECVRLWNVMVYRVSGWRGSVEMELRLSAQHWGGWKCQHDCHALFLTSLDCLTSFYWVCALALLLHASTVLRRKVGLRWPAGCVWQAA